MQYVRYTGSDLRNCALLCMMIYYTLMTSGGNDKILFIKFYNSNTIVWMKDNKV